MNLHNQWNLDKITIEEIAKHESGEYGVDLTPEQFLQDPFTMLTSATGILGDLDHFLRANDKLAFDQICNMVKRAYLLSSEVERKLSNPEYEKAWKKVRAETTLSPSA